MEISNEFFCTCGDNVQGAIEAGNEAIGDAKATTEVALEAIGENEVIGGTRSKDHFDQDVKAETFERVVDHEVDDEGYHW